MSLSKKALPGITGALMAVFLCAVTPLWSASLYTGPVSDHFDGKRFYNDVPDHTFGAMVKWLWEMETTSWPEWVDDPVQPKPPERVGGGGLRVTYINHATVLIQMDSLNILTDPIWSDRAGPFSWLGTKRVRSPGVMMEDLPRIDVILISHDHYDHLDLPTLQTLCARDQPLVLTGLGVKPFLESDGLSKVIQLDWWQEYVLKSSNMKIVFVPALHTSGRRIFEENATLWGGFIMEGAHGRVYFAGDTGYGGFLDKIKERYAGFRLTIFPMGNYEKRWFMKSQHMNPDDAVRAHMLLGSNQSVGMHFGTFVEHPEQTIDAHEEDLSKALKQHDVPASDFWILKFGEGRDVK
jgi:L-ascorbate metabolism protein UlaG (beta-lactamase superfamily)